MIFRGISFKCSTLNDAQYETIGKLWDIFSGLYSVDSIRGLGYNWTKNHIEYVFGLKDNSAMDLSRIKEACPEAVYKEILLPEDGWQSYRGTADSLSSLYDSIYKEGALTYEIETFDALGNCVVEITRQYPKLQALEEKDLEEVVALYHSALGTEGCVWNEEYPNREILAEDIASGDLYGIRDDSGRILAAVAKDRDPEVEKIGCWTEEWQPGAELARLVVREDYKNQGMARILIRQMLTELKRRGLKSVHYLVAVDNKRAVNSYKALDFSYRGEADLFGHHYECYEKLL